jgi:multidrug efflux pump
MGGILVATVLTILVLPAAYALFFGKEPKVRRVEPESEQPRGKADGEGERYPAPIAAE